MPLTVYKHIDRVCVSGWCWIGFDFLGRWTLKQRPPAPDSSFRKLFLNIQITDIFTLWAVLMVRGEGRCCRVSFPEGVGSVWGLLEGEVDPLAREQKPCFAGPRLQHLVIFHMPSSGRVWLCPRHSQPMGEGAGFLLLSSHGRSPSTGISKITWEPVLVFFFCHF